MQFTKKLLMEIQWILFKILFRAVDWLHAAQPALQLQFFTSQLLLYDFVFVLLSCSVAQLLNCSTVCSASQRPRQLIMDMAKISPEAQTQAAFIQLQTTGHSLKMGAPSTGNWAQVPSPAQPSTGQPSPGRTSPDDCLTALYMARQNRKRNVASGRGTSRGRGRGTWRGIWRTEERVLLARLLIYVRMRAALAPYSGAP